MKKRIIRYFSLLIFILMACSGALFPQDFPERPVPPRLVNDFAGLLTKEEASLLERKLVSFADSTSTQIAIVVTTDLKGYDKSDYAVRLAEKWGIGQKGLNNGILILIKSKTALSPKGEAFITTGYGLEGVIPDITCGEIIDNELLPAFRKNNYYEGLDATATTLMMLARGEFSAAQYGKHVKKNIAKNSPFGVIIIVIIILMILRSSGRSNHNSISKSGLPFWVLLGMMNSGRGSHHGSFGGFSGGGSQGGGGFGGFGGGSFGGGGAGGSW